MARSIRKSHDSAFKAKVALEAIKGEKTLTQLSSEFGVHPNQIGQWRKQVLETLPDLFSNRRQKEDYNTPQKLDRGIRLMLACHIKKETEYGKEYSEES
jgi:transposase-like protein